MPLDPDAIRSSTLPHDEFRRERTSSFSAAESHESFLHRVVREAGHELDGLIAERDTLRASVIDLRREAESLRAGRDQLLRDVDRADIFRGKAEDRLAELHAEWQATVRERDDLKGELEAIADDRADLMADRDAARKERDALKVAVRELERCVAVAESSAHHWIHEVTDLRRKLAEAGRG